MTQPENPEACREEFFQRFPSVTEKGRDLLDRYSALLREWNSRFNLVAESTLPMIWRRHFLDSAQLFHLLPKKSSIVADMGSGAGFPGLVLAILASDSAKFHIFQLVESIGKKADFLSCATEALGLDNVRVRHLRVEDLRAADKDFRADVVTARAVKPLPELLGMAAKIAAQDATLLFLKGQNVAAELTAARKWWKFDYRVFPSISDPSGSILQISGFKAVSIHGGKRDSAGKRPQMPGNRRSQPKRRRR